LRCGLFATNAAIIALPALFLVKRAAAAGSNESTYVAGLLGKNGFEGPAVQVLFTVC
jgi:hypothetical protein